MSRNTPTNADDLIDSRDIIARIEELQDERDALENDRDEAETERDDLKAAFVERESYPDTASYDAAVMAIETAETALSAAETALSDWDNSDEAEELRALTALADEAADYAPDWQYGATLIRDSHFTDYAEELVKDTGEFPRGLPDYIVIDWEATAENLKQDYTEVDFDGETYWVR